MVTVGLLVTALDADVIYIECDLPQFLEDRTSNQGI